MERISTVARDRNSPETRITCRSYWLPGLLCALLVLPPMASGADTPRRRVTNQRGGRAARQAQAARGEELFEQEQPPANQQLDDGYQDDDGYGNAEMPDTDPSQSAPADSPAVSPHQAELPAHIDPEHPLVPALKMAYASRATLAQVRDYKAQFVKKELVGNQYITHNMDMLFREQPFSVYLKFRAPSPGRQVLYVKGRNANQILVREPSGFASLMTVKLAPDSQMAMSENRHPITQIGISNMLGTVIRQWEEEGRYGAIDVQYFPDAKLGDYPVRVIRTVHDKRYRQFKFHMTQLFLDGNSLFPVRVEQFDWPQQAGGKPVLVEQYMYSGVRTNVSLSDAEFDPRAYGM